MTTYLNKATNSLIGTLPEDDNRVCQPPCSALFGDLPFCCGRGQKQPHGMPARVLLSLLFPGHILFVFILFTVKLSSTPSILFMSFYLIAAGTSCPPGSHIPPSQEESVPLKTSQTVP